MRKKTAVIILTVIMSVAFMPSMTFAASTENNSSTLESYKQVIREYVSGVYTDSVLDKVCYSNVVWDEINKEYKDTAAIIDSATKNSDIMSQVLGLTVPSDQIMYKLNIIEMLGELDKQEITGIGDLKKLKKSLKTKVEKKAATYKKSSYNSYYWDIFQQKRDDIYSEISKTDNFTDYVTAKSDAEEYLLNDDSSSGDTSWIYTKIELNIIRMQAITNITDYIENDLTAMGYKGGNDDAIFNELNKFGKRLFKIQDYEGISDAAEAELTKVAGIAGINTANYEKATHANIIRMSNKLEAIYYNYKISDYTSAGWRKIEDIYDDYTFTLGKAYIASQLKNMDTKMKKNMDSVPTYKEELKKVKIKMTKALKKIKTASQGKWYHTRIVKIADKGIAKIKKCKTIAGVNNTYKAYKKKISKAKKWY